MKSIKIVSLAIIASLFMSFAGCASSSEVTPIGPQSKDGFNKHDSVSINSISIPKKTSQESKDKLKSLIEKELSGYIDTSSNLKIDVFVTEYDKGSRRLRYMVGMGAGSAILKGYVEVSDAGEKIAKFDVEISVTGGIGGGSSEEMCDDFAKEVSVKLNKHFLNKK